MLINANVVIIFKMCGVPIFMGCLFSMGAYYPGFTVVVLGEQSGVPVMHILNYISLRCLKAWLNVCTCCGQDYRDALLIREN